VKRPRIGARRPDGLAPPWDPWASPPDYHQATTGRRSAAPARRARAVRRAIKKGRS
jgi:hypothetical protein